MAATKPKATNQAVVTAATLAVEDQAAAQDAANARRRTPALLVLKVLQEIWVQKVFPVSLVRMAWLELMRTT